MKNIIVAIVLLFFASQGLFAQNIATKDPAEDTKTIADGAKKATDQLNTTVHLSGEQYTSVYNYFYKVLSKTQEFPARAGRNPINRAINSLNYFGPTNTLFFKERDKQLKTILTSQQWKTVEESGRAMKSQAEQ